MQFGYSAGMSLGSVFAESYSLTDDYLSLLVIITVAAGVPLLVGLLRLRMAEVVFLLGFGILIGPQALGLAQVSEPIALISNLGLGFLFFFAGYELDRAVLRGTTGKLALSGWLVSVVLAVAFAVVLTLEGTVLDTVGIAIALTSTALGTLLPILRDSDRLSTKFGRNFMAAGAIGEFGPVLAISLLLGTRSQLLSAIALVGFLILAAVVAMLPSRFMNPRVIEVIRRGHSTTSQTAVRLVVLLLVALLTLASGLGLDLVLGAFAAGIILRIYMPHGTQHPVEAKLEGVAFGLFIPVFFVVTGISLDIDSIIESPGRLLLFFVLLAVVRGLPQMLVYWREFPRIGERAELSLMIATGLPIIVAVTSVEVSAGLMLPSNAAALVGAGALSVLVFPLLAGTIARRSASAAGAASPKDADAVEGDPGGHPRVQ